MPRLEIDPFSILWNACGRGGCGGASDLIAWGARTTAIPRQTGFDITVASEVMAILALSSGVPGHAPNGWGRIVLATDTRGIVTAMTSASAGAMAVLMRDA